MFPLGTVLFPHMVLPLHVFEPRYRALMHDVLADDREFGVVLISHGHEVGGGDERTDLGTIARIVQAEELDDGRWLTITVGTSRLRVERWLDDAPYPRALITDLDDDHPTHEVIEVRDRLLPRLRRVLAMQSELGDTRAEPTFDVATEPTVACWQPAILASLNPFDAQRVLSIDHCVDRLELVGDLLDGLEETLAWRIRDGGG